MSSILCMSSCLVITFSVAAADDEAGMLCTTNTKSQFDQLYVFWPNFFRT